MIGEEFVATLKTVLIASLDVKQKSALVTKTTTRRPLQECVVLQHLENSIYVISTRAFKKNIVTVYYNITGF